MNRLIKKIFAAVALLVLGVIVLVPSIILGFENEPDGFRGIKWGTNLKEIPTMYETKIAKEGNHAVYKNTQDKYTIGDAKVTGILYSAFKDRVFSVFISFKDYDNFLKLEKILKEQYGEGKKPYELLDEYRWLGQDVDIFFKYSKITSDGHISYHYKPIFDEYQNELKERAKKGAKDL